MAIIDMSKFPVYSAVSAPKASRPALATLSETFGFLPNIAGAMAGSDVLISAFVDVFRTVHAGTFTEAHIQTLLLTNAVTNACTWAVAFHTTLALQAGLELADVEAIRQGSPPVNQQEAALSLLAKRLIEQRGHLEDEDLQHFTAAGFKQEQALEVILVSAASTITNYVGNVTHPPVELAFEQNAWTPSPMEPTKQD